MECVGSIEYVSGAAYATDEMDAARVNAMTLFMMFS
jgi:hypothetical protein